MVVLLTPPACLCYQLLSTCSGWKIEAGDNPDRSFGLRRPGFGDDCPNLNELRCRSTGTDVPGALNGTYEVGWTNEQFDVAYDRTGEPRIAGTRTVADVYPGSYTLTFDDGRFDILHDRLGAFCAGHYEVTGDRTVLFAERTEPQFGCLPGRFLDASFTVTDGELRFDAATASPVDAVLFATQPLARQPDA
jgi:hypothetical protein